MGEINKKTIVQVLEEYVNLYMERSKARNPIHAIFLDMSCQSVVEFMMGEGNFPKLTQFFGLGFVMGFSFTMKNGKKESLEPCTHCNFSKECLIEKESVEFQKERDGFNKGCDVAEKRIHVDSMASNYANN